MLSGLSLQWHAEKMKRHSTFAKLRWAFWFVWGWKNETYSFDMNQLIWAVFTTELELSTFCHFILEEDTKEQGCHDRIISYCFHGPIYDIWPKCSNTPKQTWLNLDVAPYFFLTIWMLSPLIQQLIPVFRLQKPVPLCVQRCCWGEWSFYE